MRLRGPTIRNKAACQSILAVAICALLVPSAFATLGDVGFAVGISENERVLQNPNNPSIKMSEMWDTSTQRIMARNMPWLEITNLGGSTGNLLSLDITIGDTRFNFSDEYNGALVTPASGTPNGTIANATSVDGDLLSITFGNGGLAPGQTVYFRIDIGSDTTNFFNQADFRTVLFDMNGFNLYDGVVDNSADDNAKFTGTFVDPTNPTMTATAETQLPDFDVTGLQQLYYNQVRRPYGQMEGIDIFRAEGLTPSVVIPEPSTFVMAGGACIGLLMLRRRLG